MDWPLVVLLTQLDFEILNENVNAEAIPGNLVGVGLVA